MTKQALALQTPLRYVSEDAAASPSTTVKASSTEMQRLGTRCWRALINQGVPFQEARELAIAVTHFIYLNTVPSNHQKSLIDQYSYHLRATDILSLQLS